MSFDGAVDLTEDDDDFAPPPQARDAPAAAASGAAAPAAAAAAPKRLRPPSAGDRPGRAPAIGAMDRAAVDKRLAEVRKQLKALRKEEEQLDARREQLVQSDEARAEAQHARKNAVKQWDAPFPGWDERVDRALRERFGLNELTPPAQKSEFVKFCEQLTGSVYFLPRSRAHPFCLSLD